MSEHKTFGALLIEGLEGALAYERGELAMATRTCEITARDVRVDEPPAFDSACPMAGPFFAAAHLPRED